MGELFSIDTVFVFIVIYHKGRELSERLVLLQDCKSFFIGVICGPAAPALSVVADLESDTKSRPLRLLLKFLSTKGASSTEFWLWVAAVREQ